nr:alpha/beta fold hydrolase [Moraxella osloensis]
MIKRQPKPLVILIHGLHMHAWAMRPLAKKLTKLGYECHRFGYFSVAHNLANHSRRLHRWLTKYEKAGVPIYLVGHSLGGLVIRDFLQRYPQWQITRCVTLGTPHNGSASVPIISSKSCPNSSVARICRG